MFFRGSGSSRRQPAEETVFIGRRSGSSVRKAPTGISKFPGNFLEGRELYTILWFAAAKAAGGNLSCANCTCASPQVVRVSAGSIFTPPFFEIVPAFLPAPGKIALYDLGTAGVPPAWRRTRERECVWFAGL